MGKVTNITPEEREQAIYTIGKLGEEITDERIEYYVQLHRNTIKHQEEKETKEVLNDVSEQYKEYAKKVLAYMRRSKSERQILLYSKKHIETLSYIKENNMDVDYTPSLLGEAIRMMEAKKSTTIHHLTGEDLANCLKDSMQELINIRDEKEATNNARKEVKEEEGGKAIRLAKIVLIIGLILVLAPFFITGFGFNWFWYLVIIGVAFFTFCMTGVDGVKGDYSYVKSVLIGFLFVGLIMFLWGPLNPNYGSEGRNKSSYSREEVIWTCTACNKSFNYYKDDIGEHNSWKYWSGEKICHNCYDFRNSVNKALKESNSPYANYNN